jgi:hypothetical protein
MKRNLIVLIIGAILYGLVFRVVTLILGQIIQSGLAPVMPFIIIGQTLVPLIFGFILTKYLTFNNLKSVFIVILIPLSNFLIFWLTAPAENKTFDNSTDLFFLFLVVFVQPLFISIGAFIQYRIKENAYR